MTGVLEGEYRHQPSALLLAVVGTITHSKEVTVHGVPADAGDVLLAPLTLELP